MNRVRHSLAILGLAALLGGIVAEAAAQTSRPTRNRKVTRKIAKKDLKTERIIGLDWHDSLDAAIAANAASKRDKRPIFFLRILGDLTGKT